MFNAPLFQSVRRTVVRLSTEKDVIFARGSTPHTTAKVLDNLNSAKPKTGLPSCKQESSSKPTKALRHV